VNVGKQSKLIPAHSIRTLTFPLGKNEQYTTIALKSTGGLPTAIRVVKLQVKEPGGRWVSIL
jgi:hypothetical protein